MSGIPEQKLAIEWFVSTVLFYYGIWVAVNVEMVLGVTQASYIFAFLVSFASVVVASLLLINIAAEVVKDL
ncbi:MAG: hypothetical protein K0B02_04255 [DPANN group archaeon]|nr:hypothetical protein [DPANN group archaeon]